MLKADWGVSTDPGPHRPLNEDSYLAEPEVFAVADGMGGHAAGEIASGIVIAALRQLASRAPLRPDDIGTTIVAANDEIVQRGFEQSTTAGMGTTVTGVAVVSIGGSDHWAVFNVGDSRVYRFAETRLQQITVDHSEIEELIAAGYLSREQARTDHRRHIITRALGTVPAPLADLWVFPPTADEQFLICSDGLTDELTDGELQEIMRAAATPRDASSLLVNAAIRAGGRDNVTALVVGLAAAEHDSSSDIDEDTTPHVAAGTG
ncbi:MAG: PP2C family protein-serine/threonine phosphatase [Jatrophihabitans sp.]